MASVRIVALKNLVLPSGEQYKPGEELCLELHEAKSYIDSKEACLYSDFRNSMVKKRKVRVKEARENTSASTARQGEVASVN